MLDTAQEFSENSCMVDLARQNTYESYTQIFACFIAPEYRSCALERCLEMIDLFYKCGINGILSIEGGEMITSLSILRMLSRLGVRIAALTWNFSNHIASGAAESDSRRGLTEFGRQIVKEMNRIGMYIDVSHLNDRSFYDIAELSSAPIIATHSNSRAVCDHRRNLTDDMFEKIIKSGGCAGINLYPPFLNPSEKADIDDIIKHIEHFMELGGENNIGLGADFDGTDGLMPNGIRGCEDTYKIFDRLLQLNYTDEQIEKITHKNFERLFMPERNSNA
jgi:membrane dipeptidase